MTTIQNSRDRHRPGDVPFRSGESPHPVKPKDSASMLVLRKGPNGVEILMGRRGRNAVFSNAYVFAGGKVDRIDQLPQPATDLAADLKHRISSTLTGRGGSPWPRCAKPSRKPD